MTATVHILRRNSAAPSRQVEVFIERVEAELAKLPTYEREAWLDDLIARMEKKIAGRP